MNLVIFLGLAIIVSMIAGYVIHERRLSNSVEKDTSALRNDRNILDDLINMSNHATPSSAEAEDNSTFEQRISNRRLQASFLRMKKDARTKTDAVEMREAKADLQEDRILSKTEAHKVSEMILAAGNKKLEVDKAGLEVGMKILEAGHAGLEVDKKYLELDKKHLEIGIDGLKVQQSMIDVGNKMLENKNILLSAEEKLVLGKMQEVKSENTLLEAKEERIRSDREKLESIKYMLDAENKINISKQLELESRKDKIAAEKMLNEADIQYDRTKVLEEEINLKGKQQDFKAEKERAYSDLIDQLKMLKYAKKDFKLDQKKELIKRMKTEVKFINKVNKKELKFAREEFNLYIGKKFHQQRTEKDFAKLRHEKEQQKLRLNQLKLVAEKIAFEGMVLDKRKYIEELDKEISYLTNERRRLR